MNSDQELDADFGLPNSRTEKINVSCLSQKKKKERERELEYDHTGALNGLNKLCFTDMYNDWQVSDNGKYSPHSVKSSENIVPPWPLPVQLFTQDRSSITWPIIKHTTR